MSASLAYIDTGVLVARMMKRVTKHPSGCWLFDGCLNSRGYGCVGSGRKGKSILTHRLVVLHRDGEIADDLTVDHMCEVKRCVNPDHLQVVTRADNTRLRYTRWVQPIQMDGPSFDVDVLIAGMGRRGAA